MPVELRAPNPHWVQLTYTSADSMHGTHGGWGVKETSPGASQSVISRLRNGVTTRLVEVEETSQFASDAQLYQRPRRLSFLEVDGFPTLWHAVAAGPDATGRPGNVFTHAATLTAQEPSLRPIDYWRSEDWLAPFGANAVTNASLGRLSPGTAVTRQSVTSFVRESDRLYSLEWLLAGVAHVIDTQGAMVLVTESPDDAAQWLGAFSYLTAPALARRISWVTFERANDVEAACERGFAIICVPRSDLQTLLEDRPQNVLLADPKWTLEDPDQGLWHTKAGQRFPAEPTWQNAALDVLALQPDHCLRVLTAMDEFAAGVQPDEAASLPLSWPLSMALLADGNVPVANREEGLLECLSVAPAITFDTPVGRRLLEELTGGRDAAAVSTLLDESNAGDALRGVVAVDVATAYLRGEWRTWSAPPPSLDRSAADDLRLAHGQAIVAAIRQAEVDATGPPGQVKAAAHLVSFVLTHELDPIPDSDESPSPIEPVIAKLKKRLSDPAITLNSEERVRLHPALLARPAHRMSLGIESGHSPLRPASRPALLKPGTQRASTPLATSSGIAAVDSRNVTVSAIADLLRRAIPGSERARAISECLLLACGCSKLSDIEPGQLVKTPHLGLAAANFILGVPLRGDCVTLGDDKAVVEALWRAPETSAALKSKLSDWLVVFWAMAESGIVRADHRLPGQMLEVVRADPNRAVAELALFLAESRPESSAKLLCRALEFEIIKPFGSLLAAPTHGQHRLGWSAVHRASKAMDAGRLRSVLESAASQLEALSRSRGDVVVALIAEIEPPEQDGDIKPNPIRRWR